MYKRQSKYGKELVETAHAIHYFAEEFKLSKKQTHAVVLKLVEESLRLKFKTGAPFNKYKRYYIEFVNNCVRCKQTPEACKCTEEELEEFRNADR